VESLAKRQPLIAPSHEQAGIDPSALDIPGGESGFSPAQMAAAAGAGKSVSLTGS
jgi:hypothetical protein